MIKTLDRIQYSKNPPSSTNLLWDDGQSLKIFRNGAWYTIGEYIMAPDWSTNDENSYAYIKNRTHYIKGDVYNINIENCKTNTTVFDRLYLTPLIINGVYIENYGNYEIPHGDSTVILDITYREPIKYVGEDTINLNLEIITNIEIKKLDKIFLPDGSLYSEDIITEDEMIDTLNEILYEQVD